MTNDIMGSRPFKAARSQSAATRVSRWCARMLTFAEQRAYQQTRLAIVRRDLATVYGFTDHQLRDIGLDRSDILAAVIGDADRCRHV